MTNILNFNNEYGIKDVPDAYYCNANGIVNYLSTTLKRVDFTAPHDNVGHWTIKLVDCIGNLNDWFRLQHEIYNGEIKYIYLRTWKRNRNTGEDEDICFKIDINKLSINTQSLASDGEPFKFVIICEATCPQEIDPWNCPNYGGENGQWYIIDANNGEIKMSQLRQKVEEVRAKHRQEPKKRFI